MEGTEISGETKSIAIILVLTLIPLILSLLGLVNRANTYLFIGLFAMNFLLVGISATKALHPELPFKRVIRKIMLIIPFGLLFSLISTIITFNLKMNASTILVFLSSIILIFVAIIFAKSKNIINEINDPDEYHDDNLKRVIIALVILCIVSYIGMEVPPFSIIPLWYALCIPFIVIIPGYLFMNFIDPYNDEILFLERIGISFFISLIVTSIIGLILTQIEHMLNMRHVSMILAIVTLIIFIPAYAMRIKDMDISELFSDIRMNRLFIIITILAVIAIAVSGVLVSTGSVMNTENNSGSLYKGNTTFEVSGIYETPGDDGYYTFTNGEILNLSINIVNKENIDKIYTMKVEVTNDTANNTLSQEEISVGNGENKTINTNVTMSSGKKDIKFVLYNEDGQPYKIRHLYANVVDN